MHLGTLATEIRADHGVVALAKDIVIELDGLAVRLVFASPT
ncbi:MAG: hypothetical protein Q8O25_07065 [Sulfurisoma sp.]|nr:hypothetical protein [Sulfurisoma sp.]